jgi:ADP-heptose:LPS heptosyltransferase
MFNSFKKTKKEPENIREVLEQFGNLEKKYQELAEELADFKEKSKKDLQKTGMVRFNPFGEVGGDQSFSIALLDSNNNGFVITSHYARESNRV